MKRKLRTSLTPRIKQKINNKLWNPQLPLLPELWCQIKNFLENPWRSVLDKALYNKYSNRIDVYIAEIIRYGTSITKYYYENNLIKAKYISRYACYYGNIELFEWSKNLTKLTLNMDYYRYAIFGNQLSMVIYLISNQIYYNKEELRKYIIESNNINILDWVYKNNIIEVNWNDINQAYKYNSLRTIKYLLNTYKYRPSLNPLSLAVAPIKEITLWCTNNNYYPKELIKYQDITYYINRKEKLLNYLRDNNFNFNNIFRDCDDIDVIYLLKKLGYEYDDVDIKRWLDKYCVNKYNIKIETFLCYIINNNALRDSYKNIIMKYALNFNSIILIKLLRENNTIWDNEHIYELFRYIKNDINTTDIKIMETIEYLINNDFPITNQLFGIINFRLPLNIITTDLIIKVHKKLPHLKIPENIVIECLKKISDENMDINQINYLLNDSINNHNIYVYLLYYGKRKIVEYILNNKLVEISSNVLNLIRSTYIFSKIARIHVNGFKFEVFINTPINNMKFNTEIQKLVKLYNSLLVNNIKISYTKPVNKQSKEIKYVELYERPHYGTEQFIKSVYLFK